MDGALEVPDLHDGWRCQMPNGAVFAFDNDFIPPGLIESLHPDDSSNTHLKISSASTSENNFGVGADSFGLGHGANSIRIDRGATLSLIRDTDVARHGRRLAKKEGDSYALVVRVRDTTGNAPDKSASALSDDFFGNGRDPHNLKSIYFACSAGKLRIYKATGSFQGNNIVGGVLDYTLPSSYTIGSSSSGTVQGWVNSDLGSTFQNQFDLVMYVLPGSVAFDGAAAYAYVNGRLSVYHNGYASTLLVQVRAGKCCFTTLIVLCSNHFPAAGS